MKGSNLGEFEELVLLTIGALANDAYGVSIKDLIAEKTKRNPSIGALHSALSRLEDKGYIKTEIGEATKVRGGRRKKYYQITIAGKEALRVSNELRTELYNLIPKLNFALA
jgi:PadR family transcriptional regulator PadR